MKYDVTDTNRYRTTTVSALDEVVPAIRDWFPEPHPKIAKALDELHEQLSSHDQGGNWRGSAEYLGLDIEESE